MMNTKKLVTLSFFLSLAIILNIVENVAFSFFFVPGIKLGLANIASIFILYYFGYKEMISVNIMRIIIANLITGTLFGMPFVISMFSSICSMILLYIFYRLNKLSIYGISMIQAVLFNIFQIIVVCFLYGTNVFFYYLPYLIFSGLITGYLIAISASYIIKATTKVLPNTK
ncbi:MAG: Gx transporter family protein [Erysipelotrichales bacterium]